MAPHCTEIALQLAMDLHSFPQISSQLVFTSTMLINLRECNIMCNIFRHWELLMLMHWLLEFCMQMVGKNLLQFWRLYIAVGRTQKRGLWIEKCGSKGSNPWLKCDQHCTAQSKLQHILSENKHTEANHTKSTVNDHLSLLLSWPNQKSHLGLMSNHDRWNRF